MPRKKVTKNCGFCGKLHDKPGPYCSRSCGNHRNWTVEQRAVLSERQSTYLRTKAPLEHLQALADHRYELAKYKGADDWAVITPLEDDPFADWEVNRY